MEQTFRRDDKEEGAEDRQVGGGRWPLFGLHFTPCDVSICDPSRRARRGSGRSWVGEGQRCAGVGRGGQED